MEIAIPLTPRYILIAFSPHILKKNGFKYGGEWVLDSQTIELSREHVVYYNSLQCYNAYRFLFSPKDDWEFPKKVYLENPQYGAPLRQRVTVGGFGSNGTLPPDWRK